MFMNRINLKDGISILKNEDFLEIGKKANEIRRNLHPENIVTFIADTNINYTNICESKCSFCAFYREKNSSEAYTMGIDEIEEKIKEAEKLNITTALIQGGLNSKLPYSYYLKMMEKITRYSVHIHIFSPPEIDLLSKISGKSVDEVFKDLKKRGMKSMPGGGAEILSDRIRKKISPKKISSKRWLEIMEIAHKNGIKTTATLMFGHIENEEDIVLHLDEIRKLQDKTNGFTAFIMWDFKEKNNLLGEKIGKKSSPYDYLRLLAFSRIYLDNFKNIQASWASQGKEIGELALYFGANDFGSLLLEENVMKEAGFRITSTIEEIGNIIKNSGFKPALRDTFYKIVKFL